MIRRLSRKETAAYWRGAEAGHRDGKYTAHIEASRVASELQASEDQGMPLLDRLIVALTELKDLHDARAQLITATSRIGRQIERLERMLRRGLPPDDPCCPPVDTSGPAPTKPSAGAVEATPDQW